MGRGATVTRIVPEYAPAGIMTVHSHYNPTDPVPTHEHFVNRNPIFCIILGSLESLAVCVRLLRRRLPPLHFLLGIVA
jgi:hypothetical protein